MSAASISQPDFASTFNAAMKSYYRMTHHDLPSHPHFIKLQSCHSIDAVLTVLQEQVPASGQSQRHDERLTHWVRSTVNVVSSFSETISQGIGLEIPPAVVIFTGISVLLSAVKDVNASRDELTEIFNRIERFFHRLEIYTRITPTTAMTNVMVEIIVEVLTILGIATKEVKRGRLKKYLKKLTGSTGIEDSLQRLDMLTQEEALMASAEQLKMTQSVDDRVKGVEGQIQDVARDIQNVDNKDHIVEGEV